MPGLTDGQLGTLIATYDSLYNQVLTAPVTAHFKAALAHVGATNPAQDTLLWLQGLAGAGGGLSGLTPQAVVYGKSDGTQQQSAMFKFDDANVVMSVGPSTQGGTYASSIRLMAGAAAQAKAPQIVTGASFNGTNWVSDSAYGATKILLDPASGEQLTLYNAATGTITTWTELIGIGSYGVSYNYLTTDISHHAWRNNAGVLHWYNEGVDKGSITVTASDERIKRNVKPSTTDALAALKKIKMASFDQVDPTEVEKPLASGEPQSLPVVPPRHRSVGFVAQQVHKAIPEAVFTDGLWSLDLLTLVAYCVRAIQQMTE